jgi:hypothetical protein
MGKRLVSADDQVKAVVSEYRSGKRVPNFELFKALGLVVRNHEIVAYDEDPQNPEHDYDLVPVPKALLYAIGLELVRGRRHTRKHNKNRSEAAADERAEIEGIAKKIMKNHPSFNQSEVVRQTRSQFLNRHPSKKGKRGTSARKFRLIVSGIWQSRSELPSISRRGAHVRTDKVRFSF